MHTAHLRRQRKLRAQVLSVQMAILVLFFALWEVAGRLKWIDVLLFSYPSKVFAQIWKDAVSGELWGHLGVTVGETVVGFLLGTIVGTLLAVLIWWSPF
ncbi:ABC transporter permease, partial [Paenibacillus sp. AR247]